jgi:hypothetical protein
MEEEKKNGTSQLLKKLKKTCKSALKLLVDDYWRLCSRRQKIYELRVSQLVEQSVVFDRPFVYFPLHLQPEMTTSALGGVFVDQLLAIERISLMIPDDWKIYVKENPKQNFFMRDSWFFSRIKALKKVTFVGAEYPTEVLLSGCRFVATVTGTAGWEAIMGGKAVLLFGSAWYRKMPGAFEYNSKVSINDLLRFQPDLELLQSELRELLRKTGEGVIYSGYERLVPNFQHKKNHENVADSMNLILNRCLR